MTLLRFVQDLENFYNCKLSSLGRVISILNQNDHFILQRGTLYFKIISLQDWLWWIGWGWGGRNDKDTFSKKSYGRTKYFHTNNVKARKGIKVKHKTTKQKKIFEDDWVYLIIFLPITTSGWICINSRIFISALWCLCPGGEDWWVRGWTTGQLGTLGRPGHNWLCQSQAEHWAGTPATIRPQLPAC